MSQDCSISKVIGICVYGECFPPNFFDLDFTDNPTIRTSNYYGQKIDKNPLLLGSRGLIAMLATADDLIILLAEGGKS